MSNIDKNDKAVKHEVNAMLNIGLDALIDAIEAKLQEQSVANPPDTDSKEATDEMPAWHRHYRDKDELLIFSIDRKTSTVELSRIVKGEWLETYRRTTPSEAVIFAAAALQDYQPTRDIRNVDHLPANHDLLCEPVRQSCGKRFR